MAKFKVGDRVRIVRSGYTGHPSRMTGGTGKVAKVYGDDEVVVHCDNSEGSIEPNWEFQADDLELIADETPAQFEAATRDPLTILTACGIITQAQADAARALAGAL